MPDKVRLNVKKNEAVIEGGDSFLGKLIAGTNGKVKINTPFGKREVRIVKDFTPDKPKPKKKK